MVLAVTVTLILVSAAWIGDNRKIDNKVLTEQYDKCIANIPMLKDSEYALSLKECMNNARSIARSAAQ